MPKNVNKIDFFDAISISIASPEEMLSWSHGEVKKPETINYRTQKPERDGLFCEKIFGPTKNWECYCGKYKRIRYKGVICEKCGVEVTRSSVRRERMGHIKLAVPVTHIWFLRSTPSRIGLLLDLPIKTLEQVVYFAAYIVTEVDDEALVSTKEQLDKEYQAHRSVLKDEFKTALEGAKNAKTKNEKAAEKLVHDIEQESAQKTEQLDEQHRNAKDQLNTLIVTKVYSELEYRDMSMKFGNVFRAGTGAEAIREIITNLDLDGLSKLLAEELKKASGQKQKKIIKRMKLCGSLLQAGIRAEWMIMTVLPVIPPDLRPMVQLDGGRFAASDLNDLYRRVINRNNRLKKLISIGAPEVICRNEKRMLQEAVDTLLNNSARQGRTVFNTGDKRKLRSLSDMLKGKQGRFRQNLLGKRVDYSGRSVIVVGPQLQLHQCGIPKSMALELFKPFVIGRLIRDGYAHNIKSAEKLIVANKREVWDILEEVTQGHYVLLNRAPTLHRLGIQAFQPVLVEGKAIQIHPLVCTAFNADFDGDQMAVHVPLSKAAQAEAKSLIVSAGNILKPSSGEPIVTPTQDMVLGCYYLTKITDGKKGQGMVFSDLEEAMIAYQTGHTHLQAPIKARVNDEIIETTIGRMIFNSLLPEALEYHNETITKGGLSSIIDKSFNTCGKEETALLVDRIKKSGFEYATISGISIAASDMTIPSEKQVIIDDSSEVVKLITNQYGLGLLTDDERYRHTIKVWSEAKTKVTALMTKTIDEENNLHYMINSGARGNWGQITQLCGLKGLVANPAGKTIELPIKSNLKEGFSILEYFIATHGGRKGKSDTALKTAEAGYLTRRLVDAVQDVIIKKIDCGSDLFIEITREESEEIGEDFNKRIYGRTIYENVNHPKTKKTIGKKGLTITKAMMKDFDEAKVDNIKVRSILTCQTANGICQKCYGKDLASNRTVDIGTAVGIIAAQSIGEPGTQLTMRTFHMGGVAEGDDITQGLTRVEELFEARSPKQPAILSDIDGKVKINQKGKKTDIIVTTEGNVTFKYPYFSSMKVMVKKGDIVKEKQTIVKAITHKFALKVLESGKVTAIKNNVIEITTVEPISRTYAVPSGKSLKVKNGQIVKKGEGLTSGHIDLRQLLELTDTHTVQKYIIKEVQSIYASQGQQINDKHFEIISRQMSSKTRIIEPGDTPYLPGQVVDILELRQVNKETEKAGKNGAQYEELLLGLTRIALQTESWLSAASFQETIRVLVEAATTSKVDNLAGLKENVIIGKLIPAGTTYQKMHPEIMAEVAALEPKKPEAKTVTAKK